MKQLINLLGGEELDEATRLAATEAIDELAESISGDLAKDADVTDRQADAAGRLRRLAPGAWNAVLPVLQSLLTSTAQQKLGLP